MDVMIMVNGHNKENVMEQNVKKICAYLEKEYNATVATPEECNCFLEEGKKYILGMHFNDSEKNYSLLSKNDFKAMDEICLAHTLKSKRSPYKDILLIFYKKTNEEVSYKIVNGMASVLFQLVGNLICKYPL